MMKPKPKIELKMETTLSTNKPSTEIELPEAWIVLRRAAFKILTEENEQTLSWLFNHTLTEYGYEQIVIMLKNITESRGFRNW